MNAAGLLLIYFLFAGLAIGSPADRNKRSTEKPPVPQYELSGVVTNSGAVVAIVAGVVTNVANVVWEFQVWRRADQWCIRTRERGVRGKAQFWETGTANGREIFYSTQWPPRDAEAEAYAQSTLIHVKSTNKISIGQNEGLVIVESNTVPVDARDGLTPHLWLMFAGGPWLAGQRTNSITPVYDVQVSTPYTPEYRQEARWTLRPEPPFMPEAVVYWNDGWLRMPNFLDMVRTTQRHRPYDQGFTNAVYHATGFTNLGGWLLPTGFIYTRYEPSPMPSREVSLREKERLTAVVTEWRAVCGRASLLPVMQERMGVVDNRLRYAPEKKEGVAYSLRPGEKWPGVERARKEIRAKAWRQTKKKHGPAALVVLLVLAVGPIAALQILRVWNSRKTTPA